MRFFYSGLEAIFFLLALMWTLVCFTAAKEEVQRPSVSGDVMAEFVAKIVAMSVWWAGFIPLMLLAAVFAIASNTARTAELAAAAAKRDRPVG